MLPMCYDDDDDYYFSVVHKIEYLVSK